MIRDSFQKAADDVRAQMAILVRLHAELARWEAWAAPDSFPTGMGGESNAVNELDDDGTPIPQHADPTYRAVVARGEPASNPVRAARLLIERNVVMARDLFDAALNKARQIPEGEPKAVRSADDPFWCHNHLRANINEPVRPDAPNTGLCRWCAEWKAAAPGMRRADRNWPLLPTKRMMERRARGERITDRVIAECLGKRTA